MKKIKLIIVIFILFGLLPFKAIAESDLTNITDNSITTLTISNWYGIKSDTIDKIFISYCGSNDREFRICSYWSENSMFYPPVTYPANVKSFIFRGMKFKILERDHNHLKIKREKSKETEKHVGEKL